MARGTHLNDGGEGDEVFRPGAGGALGQGFPLLFLEAGADASVVVPAVGGGEVGSRRRQSLLELVGLERARESERGGGQGEGPRRDPHVA
jgi:hypothetical protein